MANLITTIQIQGLDAKELLTQFERLNNRLDQIQKKVKQQPETVLLTRKEVAELLNISLPTLWAWTNKDLLQAYRIGNKIRYKKSEVLNALQRINLKQ